MYLTVVLNRFKKDATCQIRQKIEIASFLDGATQALLRPISRP